MARVYAVESTEELTLVKANSQAQALNHVAKGQFKVKAATAMDVVDYIQAGGVIEDATNEATPALPDSQDAADAS